MNTGTPNVAYVCRYIYANTYVYINVCTDNNRSGVHMYLYTYIYIYVCVYKYCICGVYSTG